MKFTKIDKTVIAMTDLEKYNIFQCNFHGVYSMIKKSNDFNCIYCDRPSENITEKIKPLQADFQEQVGVVKYE